MSNNKNLNNKNCQLTYYSRTFPIAVLVLWAILEPVRLYYGIYGNLNESVSIPSIQSFPHIISHFHRYSIGCTYLHFFAHDNISTTGTCLVFGIFPAVAFSNGQHSWLVHVHLCGKVDLFSLVQTKFTKLIVCRYLSLVWVGL